MPTNNGSPENTFLTVEELASRYSIPTQTVYGWRVANKGPRGLKIGRYVRYRLSDVIAWEKAQAEV